jgi:hypothetical protein
VAQNRHGLIIPRSDLVFRHDRRVAEPEIETQCSLHLIGVLDEEARTSRDLWLLSLKGDRKPTLLLQTDFDERQAQFSPDGHWITYMSNEMGTSGDLRAPVVGVFSKASSVMNK